MSAITDILDSIKKLSIEDQKHLKSILLNANFVNSLNLEDF